MFPYARSHLPGFVQKHQDDPQIRALLDDVCREAGIGFDLAAAVAQLVAWIDEDKKVTPLKSLQGLIWETGYCQGDFKGHVYPDAAQALVAWHQQGLGLYVYSSGSVQAQKLLFAHTEYGDMTPLFSGYFDTHIGGKRDALSYRNIQAAVGVPAAELLFLSDIVEELDAAKASGFRTVCVNRGSDPISGAKHEQVHDFSSIGAEMLTD